MPRPSSRTPVKEVGERPRRSSASASSRRRQKRRRDKAREAAAAAADDSLDDAATMIHPWAPSWAREPIDHAPRPKSAPAPAISTPRGWQGPHSSVGGERKMGLLEAAVVAAGQREEDRLRKNRKNNNAGGGALFQVLCCPYVFAWMGHAFIPRLIQEFSVFLCLLSCCGEVGEAGIGSGPGVFFFFAFFSKCCRASSSSETQTRTELEYPHFDRARGIMRRTRCAKLKISLEGRVLRQITRARRPTEKSKKLSMVVITSGVAFAAYASLFHVGYVL